MTDQTAIVRDPHDSPVVNDHSHESTDERLRRLENAIAAMQDTRLMEQRLLEKVANRIEQMPTANQNPILTQVGSTVLRAVGSEIKSATTPGAPLGSGSMFSAKSWLLTDLILELRTFATMFFDFRYKTSWTAKITPVAAMILFLLSWIFIHGSIPIVGNMIGFAFDLLLFVVTYKTMQREAARYQTHIAAFPVH